MMSWWEDPHVQKGILGTIAGLFMALYTHLIWYFRRRVRKVDDIDNRVAHLEQHMMTREEADVRFNRVFGEVREDNKETREEIRQVHQRVDKILHAVTGNHGE